MMQEKRTRLLELKNAISYVIDSPSPDPHSKLQAFLALDELFTSAILGIYAEELSEFVNEIRRIT